MQTYISLLRGINVNGQKLIKMDALRALYERVGFQDVQSYLQSGNVIFKAATQSPAQLAAKLMQAIQDCFGFEVPILVLEPLQLQGALKENPFSQKEHFDSKQLYFTFLYESASLDDFAAVVAKKSDTEELMFAGRQVYLYCPNGYGKTKLSNNFIENKLKVLATTRNWKTVDALYTLASK